MTESHQTYDHYLFRVGGDRQWMQDSPVLPNVWRAYVEEPDGPVDLLVTPHRACRPPELAARIRSAAGEGGQDQISELAYNQSLVVVRLPFDAMIRLLVPMSSWFGHAIRPHLKTLRRYARYKGKSKKLRELLDALENGGEAFGALPPIVVWWTRLVGHLACHQEEGHEAEPGPEAILKRALELLDHDEPVEGPGIFKISVNRIARGSCEESVRTVKADAASRVFDVDTRRICWAVLDSGIDARHPAFADDGGESRIKETYDFTRVRQLFSLASAPGDGAAEQLQDLFGITPEQAREIRTTLSGGGDVDWEALRPALRVTEAERDAYTASISSHGTHVAGILGGRPTVDEDGRFAGVCPDISLVDIRILDRRGRRGEFDITSALQFVGHLNAASDEPVIHGVNLSIQLPHDPKDYAAGRTPVCEECNRLVANGVVVVAAAGNKGIDTEDRSGVTEEGAFRGISITDPGNAEAVITVGSTHRKRPHAYGVSFFSSRGPTGDGRRKPDLVAPGERILGPVLDGKYARMQGTSQAAPHVSGAAAMLLARHREFVGQPGRVKEILCQTATDLGRERDFQGAGLVDALRALQSV